MSKITTLVFNTSTTWICPAGITRIHVYGRPGAGGGASGGGGGGGRNSLTGGGGGGGNGGHLEEVLVFNMQKLM